MAPSRFRIRNWEKFQHYKDRNPPWIKLHVEILASEDWVTVDDASKLLAVVCMIVAAKHGGDVPNNPDYIRRVAYLSTTPNLKPLIACGFLENTQASDSEQAQPLAAARPEKEAETEGEKKEHMSDKSDLTVPVSPKPKAGRRTYPDAFEQFWRDYPTDSLMSKLKAFEKWQRLTPEDRDAAAKAIPAFKNHCKNNPTYRPVHAERFISERRFDGFNLKAIPGGIAPDKLAEVEREEEEYRRKKWGNG